MKSETRNKFLLYAYLVCCINAFGWLIWGVGGAFTEHNAPFAAFSVFQVFTLGIAGALALVSTD